MIRRMGPRYALALSMALGACAESHSHAQSQSTRGTPDIVTVVEPASESDPHYAEPHFATNPRDPSQIVLAAIGVRLGSGWNVSAFSSGDGGRSWRETTLPLLGELRCFGDPWVVWGAGQTAYLVCLTQRPIPGEDDWNAAVMFYRSDDAGRTWRVPVIVPDDDVRGSWDHPVARRTPGGDVVVVGTRSRVGPDGFAIARYRADEHRFEPLRSYLPPEQVNDNMGGAAALLEGRVAFTYFTMGDGQRPMYAVRVTPEGEERVVVREHVTPWGFPMLAARIPSASEPVRLFAVWLEGASVGGLDVYLGWSDDEGRTWSVPAVVNAGEIAAFRAVPQVAVDERGAVAVMWYDTRHTSSPTNPQPCGDIYVRRFDSGGTPAGPELRVTENGRCPEAPDPAGVRQRWRAGGDYLGLELREGAMDLVWAEPGPKGSRIRFARMESPPEL